MSRVLFLCSGNTCRSPLAEVFAQDFCPGQGMAFQSAGLQVAGESPASEGSCRVAITYGLDLSGHLSRPVSRAMLLDMEWVIGMTRSHAAIFRSRFQDQYEGKIGILGQPGLDLTGVEHSVPCEEVGDPYQGGEDEYAAVGEQIRRLVQQWVPVFGTLKP